MRMEKGTPGFGIVLGLILAGCGALVMWIGFWKALVLFALFVIGYFLGSVENKGAFLKDTANRLIPNRDEKTIDFRKEITQEQEKYAAVNNREDEE